MSAAHRPSMSALSSVPHTIRLQSALPDIKDPVTILGMSQPGYVDKPVIELDGTNAFGVARRIPHHRRKQVEWLDW